MATRKSETGAARYRTLRDVSLPDGQVAVGELVVLDAVTAEQLVRDGMVVPEEGA